ncbi:MAG: RDD family protein [Bdellovibrio sp.]|nr:RDD family protein [Bdellovibrio sp.]
MTKGHEVYAGFWIRTVALLIDCVLFMIPVAIASRLIFPSASNPATINENPQIIFLNMFFQIFCSVLYFGILQAFMHGTPGKRAVGLKIVAADLTPVSFGQCLGRYFASWVSSLIFCLGYLWVGFSEKKQGWHDKMAGTCVVKARYLKDSGEHSHGQKHAA